MNLAFLYQLLKKVAVINIIRHATQLLIGILIARWLGPSEKGNLFLFTTVSATIAVLLSFGITNSIIYHCKKNILSFSKGLFYLIWLIGFQYLILIIIKYFSGDYISEFLFKDNEHSEMFFNLLIVYCLVTLINYFINAYCLSFQYFGLYFISFAFSSVVVGGMNIIGLLYYDFQLNNVLLIFTLVELITSLFVILFILLKYNSSPVNRGSISSVFGFAIKSHLGVSGSTLLTNGDSFILASLLSNEQIGIYSVAKTFYRLLIIFPQTINGILFGIFCDTSKVEARKLLNKLVLLFVISSFVVLLTTFYILDDLIVLVYGNAFQTAYQSAMILICAACLVTISSSVNPYLLAFNKPLATSTITLISASFSLLCSIYLVGIIGILGAALSTLFGALCTFTMRLYFYKKER